MKTYMVEATFGGYIGTYTLYRIDAEDDDQARSLGLQKAIAELSVTGAKPVDETNWCITITFNGIRNGARSYIVEGNEEQGAKERAQSLAKNDISVRIAK